MNLSVCVFPCKPFVETKLMQRMEKENKMLLSKRSQKDMKSSRRQIIDSVIVPGWLENKCCDADLHN